MAFPISISETFREHWPEKLLRLAAPAKTVRMNRQDIFAIGWHSASFREAVSATFPPPAISDTFTTLAKQALANMPAGAFPKLGYCSWKGTGAGLVPVYDYHCLITAIKHPDPRIDRALLAGLMSNNDITLHLIEWRDIPEYSEFRLFFRSGEFVGASQYHKNIQYDWLTENESQVKDAITRFIPKLNSAMHIENAAADVFVFEEDNGLNAELIEINPFSIHTDTCLFDWHANDFDASIRLVAI